MPIKKCSHNGKSGWKYGDSGKCFIGPDAKQKAIKQMQAIKVSQQKHSASLLDQIVQYFIDRNNG